MNEFFTVKELDEISKKAELLMLVSPDENWRNAYKKIFDGSVELKELISEILDEVKKLS